MTSQSTTSAPKSLSPQDYMFFAEQSDDLVSVHNWDDSLAYASSALERTLGYRPGELVSKSFGELVNLRDFPQIKAHLQTLTNKPFVLDNAVEFRRKDGKSLWLTARFQTITESSYVIFYQNQTRVRQLEDLMQVLAFDPRTVPDEAFFRGLLWSTARAVEVDYAFLTTTKSPFEKVRMLAFWKGDHFADTYEYALDDTPCDRVIRHGEELTVPFNVQGYYPKDQDLVALNAQSYVGVPIYNHSKVVIGHLALLDRQVFKMTPFRKSITTVFARQIATIMEKL